AAPSPSLVQRSDRLPTLRALRGLLGRELLGPELDRAVLGVDEDGVAFLVLPREDLLGKRVEDELLDGAADRPRAVDRVVALLRDERLRVGRELERDLPLGEPLRERVRLE